MEKILLLKLNQEEERIRILRALNKINLRHFSLKYVKNAMIKYVDHLVCEVVFQIHMELRTSGDDTNLYTQRIRTQNKALLFLAEQLNVLKMNQDVDCPKCFVLVKCLWLSKHLAGCINPHQSTYSYSSRSSSRIARQRIQEGFKTCYDESKSESDSERIRPKRHSNKRRKTRSVR